MQGFQFCGLLPLSTLDQFALLELNRLPPAASTHSNSFERSIGIFGHQWLVAESYGLGVAQHMRLTHLALHIHLISVFLSKKSDFLSHSQL
jgi:hypothetical protein